MDVNIMDIWLSEIQCYRTYDVLFQAISIWKIHGYDLQEWTEDIEVTATKLKIRMWL
jgi:hypothetical protein